MLRLVPPMSMRMMLWLQVEQDLTEVLQDSTKKPVFLLVLMETAGSSLLITEF